MAKDMQKPQAPANESGAEPDFTALLSRYDKAKNRRQGWESHWRECYDYALPQRGEGGLGEGGGARVQDLYDATALDAVDQLAASLLGNLTPPWSNWFGFKPGPALDEKEAELLSPLLESAAQTIQAHFDRSNFAVEMHQCFLDLVVGGTAAMYFEETEPGAYSAFKFSAVPLQDAYLEEGRSGFLDGSFRRLALTLEQLEAHYPKAALPPRLVQEGLADPQKRFEVLETVLPDGAGYAHHALLAEGGQPALLTAGRFRESPLIAFRWLKSPGETYGRSPVMKALPDIKTANKIVELVLKNASISVTGIWQADDDGVINPANIELVPGAIIPKAVGSAGLKPLEMPGRFDVSELVLSDLRGRIRHALLADRLAQITDRRMTATEVLERTSEMALLLGATYGRLQSELLTPLIRRAYGILRRRGEVPDLNLDGRYVVLDYRSPLARAQGQRNIQNTLMWIESVLAMGPEASAAVNLPRAARFLGDALGVPSDLIVKDAAVNAALD